ncbi:MAG: hypothetical protein HKL84_08500 [Acidimicrobiaceae bacterium]|nr:hypothetical protein [Acidimicrobiaceae bacterium]
MSLSKSHKVKFRKYVPLALLYPLSTAIGIISTLYVSKAINQAYSVSNTSNSSSSGTTSTTTPPQATTTTLSPQQQQEQQQLAALQSRISQIQSQIQKLDGTSGSKAVNQAPSTNNSGTTNSQAPRVQAQNPASIPKVVATSPPPVHGSTGASHAIP